MCCIEWLKSEKILKSYTRKTLSFHLMMISVNPGKICGNQEDQISNMQWITTLDCPFLVNILLLYQPLLYKKVSEDPCPLKYKGSCHTVSEPSLCKKCVFPFSYHGVRYYRCTHDEKHSVRPWCATSKEYKEDSANTSNLWGDCSEECSDHLRRRRKGKIRKGKTKRKRKRSRRSLSKRKREKGKRKRSQKTFSRLQ